MRYSILNQSIDIENQTEQSFLFPLSKYVKEEVDNIPMIKIQIREIEIGGYGIETVTKNRRDIYNLFFSEKDYKQVLCALSQEYTEFILSVRDTCSEEVFLELFITAFYSYISMQEALLMHASCVSYKNTGIVFTASSGVGKTTQAELWAKHEGAKILNGDKVFLKRENNGIHAWGSPWKGSSPYTENESAPLKAIVVLEQAEENSIEKLEGLDVLEHVVPHVFFPSWDIDCEQKVLSFLDKVLEETEVYLLKCRPDESAVELLASVIKES